MEKLAVKIATAMIHFRLKAKIKWLKKNVFRTEVMYQQALTNVLIVGINIQINLKLHFPLVLSVMTRIIQKTAGIFCLVKEIIQMTHIQIDNLA